MVDTSTFSAFSSTTASKALKPPPPKRGWARKYKNVIRGYKKRYIVLDGDIFSYFESEKQAQVAMDARLSSMQQLEESSIEDSVKQSMVVVKNKEGKKEKI